MFFNKYFSISSIVCLLNFSANAQIDKYQYPGSINDLYTVYEYKKSNWDGTHASTIYLYIADTNKIQSFKWTQGDKVATLVTAVVDWNNFSVKQFINHRLRSDKEPELVATLIMKENMKIAIEVGAMQDSLTLTEMPWHSYDFDLAGLGFTWRALKDKSSSFYFHIADAALVNGNMAFINKGRAQVKYEGKEMINGNSCLKYFVDGAGLENKGGHIWINAASFMIEKYKIALPDEPGFENGMLQLVKTSKMNSSEWNAFMASRLQN